jgi:peptide deformylase
MTILPLVVAPDPRLLICSEPVDKVTDEIRQLMDDMVETMRHEDGVGLAAVQVGIHKRILVMEIDDKLYYVVNPEIITSSEDENIYEEGCLSFPKQRALVTRPKKVTVKCLGYQGEEQMIECDELLATCIQHEIDHLNGIVFIDHLSRLKKDTIMRKVQKLKKLQAKL